ncbi:RTA1-domain-containing protein, partial [Lophiostoma macrostomum CBS 122681]
VRAENADINPYVYESIYPLAVGGAVIFSLIALTHCVIFFRGKTWFFWAMLVGVLMESVGFAARAISINDLQNHQLSNTGAWAFFIGYLALILAPSFIAAACYATFGRIVWWVAPVTERSFRVLWCPPRFITIFFVAFDLGSFFIQLIGASSVGSASLDKSLGASERDKRTRDGQSILKFGLVLQLICFGIFTVIGIRFIAISRRWSEIPLRHGAPHVQWQRLNWTVNISAFLIMVRAIYRIFDFTGNRGSPSYAQSHEWTFWLFDALPVLAVIVGFVIYHPARYLPSNFLSLRLHKRGLQKVEQSSPPDYLYVGPNTSLVEGIQLEQRHVLS